MQTKLVIITVMESPKSHINGSYGANLCFNLPKLFSILWLRVYMLGLLWLKASV